jgi:hypothetical protein
LPIYFLFPILPALTSSSSAERARPAPLELGHLAIVAIAKKGDPAYRKMEIKNGGGFTNATRFCVLPYTENDLDRCMALEGSE